MATHPHDHSGAAKLSLVRDRRHLIFYDTVVLGVLHYHTDHVGSIQLITDAGGGIYEQIRYKPYGEVRGHCDADGTLQPVNTCSDDGYCREPEGDVGRESRN